jgi:phospho-N-acetylmuramoyl-pentapeptide-transferase
MDSHLIQIFSFWIATFLIGFIFAPFYIKILKKAKLWKQIREKATIWKATEFFKLHKKKSWTPTMWWALILVTVFFMVLVSMILQWLWVIENSLLDRKETYLILFTLFTVWVLWAIDDFMNIKWIWKTKGLSARFKMLWLIVFAILWALWFYFKLDWSNKELMVPFLENSIYIWVWIIPLFIFIIIASANSVNITDWLDGLAWWLLLFAYCVYTYITFDQWLFLLSALCVSIIWSLAAFLWFNIKPAKFYMWDIWSLSLWAALWIIAMITNTIFILLIISSIFIFNTLSVIIQLISKKLRWWKKVFKIAPFHHHLEASWWSEETVVFRLWLIWMIFSIFWVIFYILQK